MSAAKRRACARAVVDLPSGRGINHPSFCSALSLSALLRFHQLTWTPPNKSKSNQKVDALLQQYAVFWSNMEVGIQCLVQKTDHVSGLVSFARNPRLRQRFQTRVAEYAAMWKRMETMSENYIREAGAGSAGRSAPYTFLNDAGVGVGVGAGAASAAGVPGTPEMRKSSQISEIDSL